MVFLEKSEPEDERLRGRRARRHWTPTPPPVAPLRESEGACILDEVPPPLALVLWQRFRDIHLWATGKLWTQDAVHHRHGLFAEETGKVPLPSYMLSLGNHKDLSRALRTFNSLVLDPLSVDDTELASACLQAAEWAGAHGAEATEASFVNLAATIRPSDAHLACKAGRVERKRGNYLNSGDWFRRAVSIARKTADHPAYIDAFLGWGLTEERRGRKDRARSRYIKAYRRAREAGLTKLGARARHNMIALSIPPFGTLEEGMAHAEAALKLYGRSDPRIPALASDIAAFWNEHGIFAPGLPVLEAALPLLNPMESTATLANIARAAAVMGDSARFFAVWDALSALERQNHQLIAPAFAELAEAARVLGLARQSAEIAEKAARIAERRGEPATRAQALAVLQALRDGAPRTRDQDAPSSVHDLAHRLTTQIMKLVR